MDSSVKDTKSALAIQCIPMGEGEKNEVYSLVDRAIAVIEASGLPFTVGPFETVVEGPLERLVILAGEAHAALLEAGAGRAATYIKLWSGAALGSSEEKVGKFRKKGH
jgi:uncharacterized protein YqgV (UPF0045/DUF77 family)